MGKLIKSQSFLPSNLEYEKEILGYILNYDPSYSKKITPNIFCLPDGDNQRFFEAICEMIKTKEPIAADTLMNWLRSNKLYQYGDGSKIGKLIEYVAPCGPDFYLEKLQIISRQRQSMIKMSQALEHVKNDPQNYFEICSQLSKDLAQLSISTNNLFEKGFECCPDEQYLNGLGEESWIFRNLLISQQITTLIAESGFGKTTIMWNYVVPSILQQNQSAQIWYLDCDSATSDHKSMGADVKYWNGRLKWINPYSRPGKNVDDILNWLKEVSQSDISLNNITIFLDTLKKFTDILSKKDLKNLFSILRALSSKGGTICCLGHANKYRSPEGYQLFEGTGDVKSDSDNLIFLERITEISGDGQYATTIVDMKYGAKVRGIFEPISFHIEKGTRQVTMCDHVINPALGEKPEGTDGPQIKYAMNWLKVILEEGPRKSAELLEWAKQDGISEKTLRRAKKKMGIIIEKTGFSEGSKWSWRLPK